VKKKVRLLTVGGLLGGILFIGGLMLEAPMAVLLAFEDKTPSSPEPTRAADRGAIDKLKQSLAHAFSEGDSAKVAALLTDGAELIPEDAPSQQGRQNIQQAFEQFFRDPANRAKLEFQPDEFRFISRDLASEEGQIKITKGHAAPRIKEWDSTDAEIEELDWLIGSWEAKQGDIEVHTTYEWFGEKAFIRSNITLTIGDITRSGMQVIGKDPRTDELLVWTFEVSGGMAEGSCSRDGDAWLFQTEGMSSDGNEVSNTNILARINHDTMTWQPVNITVDGEQRKNLPPVKVTRVKRAK
jgi:uncharacterized protein (TIGR02246 family)